VAAACSGAGSGPRPNLVTLAELDTIFDRYKKPLPKPDVANDQARAALYIEIDTAMTNRGRHIADLLYD